jgi:hypothetical protein
VAAITLAAAAMVARPPAARAQPQLPATYYGTASIDGKPPPAGSEVRGFIDGKDCTQGAPGSRPIAIENGVAEYVILVVHESQVPGCGHAGATVTFTIGGQAATQTSPWSADLHRLDLNAGSGAPVPLPTGTTTPTPPPGTTPATAPASPLPSATTTGATPAAPPTDDIPLPFLTPKVSGGTSVAATQAAEAGRSGGGGSGGDGTPGWVLVAGGAAVVALVGGVAGVLLSRRGRGSAPPA